jgi:hypothetical protein
MTYLLQRYQFTVLVFWLASYIPPIISNLFTYFAGLHGNSKSKYLRTLLQSIQYKVEIYSGHQRRKTIPYNIFVPKLEKFSNLQYSRTNTGNLMQVLEHCNYTLKEDFWLRRA